ncbi:AMP-binding protein [Amycolatopsis rhizosphaerae]|uniref:AMP-binding protein n=1 Tax=Amycolatopsis rhizosphaerae TaxID=2053003 RepID=A0A558A3V1_9PSEU|nr:AMP-binding protein [Amycolatopsis rhizosphaerae]TVT18961.1 AMP-binding protein [Amycolatopsis rhizosphaerae]
MDRRQRLEAYLSGVRARQEKVRPAGTPSEVVYPLGEIAIPEHVAHWARRYPDRPAIEFEGRTTTYGELDELTRRLAGWLESAGVRAGDRVGVYLPNTPQFVVAMLAALRLGAVHVPVNPMFQTAELAHELADSGAEVVITLDALLPTLASARDETPVRTVLVTGAREMAAEATPPVFPDGAVPSGMTSWAEATAHGPAADRPGDLDALAALNYTGGTTGAPKGCEHTQRHMLYTAASSAGATRTAADSGFAALCYIPIFWIAGENLGILHPLVLGGTSVLMPRWNAPQVLELIQRHRVTTMVGTVENYLELLDQPGFGGYDLSSLTDPMAVSFVRKLDPEVRGRWTAAVGTHSVLREGAYGMTETHTFDTTPFGFAGDDFDLLAEPVFCGIPVPGTDIAVVSFDTGDPVPLGVAGEIIVRSPSVMTRYWRNPEATAEQLRDGWLHTGDNGRLDADGCLHYLGRDKDMIKVKGMSVFPAEVEMLLARHPEVFTVAVVPAGHPDKGQVPVAFVSLCPGATVDAAGLREWARTAMASYKVPLVEIVTAFPMTATGKIRKVELAGKAQRLVTG